MQTAPVTVNVSNVAIDEVVITPVESAGRTLPVGSATQFGVIATFADNVKRDITQSVDWTTAASYLSVSNGTLKKGKVNVNQARPPADPVGTIVVTDPEVLREFARTRRIYRLQPRAEPAGSGGNKTSANRMPKTAIGATPGASGIHRQSTP